MPPWVQAGGYEKWAERDQDPLDTIIDIVIEDGYRVGTVYFVGFVR